MALGNWRPKALTRGTVTLRPRLGGRPSAKWPESPLRLILEFLAGAADLRQDAARVFQQPRSRIGEHHAASIAVEQALPEFDLQLPHLAAQGRLHHGEEGRRAGEAAELRDMAEILELLQIHARLALRLCHIVITGMSPIP